MGGEFKPPTIGPRADTEKPAIRGIRASALANRRVRVRFSLSEQAAVTMTFKRAGRRSAVRTVRVMGRSGTNTVVVRSGQFTAGRRFTVELEARDAVGNRSSRARAGLTMRRTR